MYKCLECGHVFTEDECATWVEHHGFTDGTGEEWQGCPICHGGFDETVICVGCGEDFLDDELYGGLCLSCLREAITYDVFLDYLTDRGILDHFMFEKLFDSTAPYRVGRPLMDHLREWYLRQKADDLLRGSTYFLDLCRQFVLEDDGECGRYDFAEWLEDKRKEGRR